MTPETLTKINAFTLTVAEVRTYQYVKTDTVIL